MGLKKISIENYARRRGLQAHTLPMSKTTPAGKLAHEYYDLLQIEDPSDAIQQFLKKWSELNDMKKHKKTMLEKLKQEKA